MKYHTKNGKIYDLDEKYIFSQSDLCLEYAISSELAATIFNPYYMTHYRAQIEKIVTRMIDSSKGKSTQFLAWPKEILYDEGGEFAGYTMTYLIGKTLHEAFDDQSLSWKDRVVLASKLCVAMKNVHEMGHKIGIFFMAFGSSKKETFDRDLYYIEYDHKNELLVTECTIFQIHDTDNKILEGATGDVSMYSSPEHIDIYMNNILSHKDIIFTKNSDYFSLAIIIFRLLSYGTHPFLKGWTWDYEVGIHSGFCILFPETCEYNKVKVPNFTLALDEVFPPDICKLFKRTFVYGHKVPKLRATADDWYSALSDLLLNLKHCEHNPMHYYHRSLQECPWCLNEKRILKNKDSSLGNTVRKLFGHR